MGAIFLHKKRDCGKMKAKGGTHAAGTFGSSENYYREKNSVYWIEGMAEVDEGIYTSGQDFIVDSAKMLQEGKLIAVRTHTRFVHFPSHRHNFLRGFVCL